MKNFWTVVCQITFVVLVPLQLKAQDPTAIAPAPSASPAPSPSPSAATPGRPLSKEDIQFVWSQNALINADLKASKSRDGLLAALKLAFSNPVEFNRWPLANKSNLIIRRLNYTKPIELVIKTDQAESVLFDTNALAKNGSYAFFNASLSADQNTLAMAFAKDGSIDDFEIVVFDLLSKTIAARLTDASEATIGWISNDKFLYYSMKPDFSYFQKTYDRTSKIATEGGPQFKTLSLGWNEFWNTTTQSLWLISKSGQTIQLSSDVTKVSNVLLVDQTQVILAADGQILKFDRDGNGGVKNKVVLRGSERVLESSKIAGAYLIALSRWGADHWIEIKTATGSFVDEVKVPNCCSVQSVNWDVEGQTLKVSFVSAVSGSTNFIYDLSKKSWSDPDLEKKMLTAKGVTYATEVVNIPSRDGTLIPMRLTHRADIKPSGNVPTLFEQYGGFNEMGKIDPRLSLMVANFLKDGGLYAAPAIRGGGEYGTGWNNQAKQSTKNVTMLDLIDCVRWAQNQNWTNPKLTAITGTSNGGLVVASAALQASESIGLSIPIAGVDDLLHKEILDPRFEDGWSPEYGDSRQPDAHDWLAKFSPVELAKTQPHSNFLVIAGTHDSRVNPEHSIHLTQELESRVDQTSKVRMLGMKNSGHWLMSPASENPYISMRANLIYWTTIYDFMGMQTNP